MLIRGSGIMWLSFDIGGRFQSWNCITYTLYLSGRRAGFLMEYDDDGLLSWVFFMAFSYSQVYTYTP